MQSLKLQNFRRKQRKSFAPGFYRVSLDRTLSAESTKESFDKWDCKRSLNSFF
jgi:hypothetical protein